MHSTVCTHDTVLCRKASSSVFGCSSVRRSDAHHELLLLLLIFTMKIFKAAFLTSSELNPVVRTDVYYYWFDYDFCKIL